jgi:membrane-bound lytic murein transglycosylase B
MIANQKKKIESLALEKGVSKETSALAHTLVFNSTVSTREVRQPERTLTFKEYFEKTMPEYKILDAKKFLIDNWDELDKVEKEYKVDKEIIVALMLIETYFGKILGTFNIMDSLFTLTLTSHRPDFWQTELLHIFTLIDSKKTLYTRDTKGSWAGAVGMVQFIPSSFIKLAKDGDGDGVVDTVSSKMDAFASAANYLQISGWKYKEPYLKSVDVSLTKEEFCKKAGLEYEDGVLVFPDKKLDTPSFVVYKNFSVVLLWNKSLFFSTTAGLVFNELKDVSKNHP